jgi:hypothetical protein
MATPQQLATASTQFDNIPVGLGDAVIIYLLGQLAGVTDPQTLVTNARCYDCIPVGLRSAVIVYLQDAILAGGGGGGSPEVFLIADGGTPVTVPISGAGFAYTVAGDAWTYGAGNWNKIISA